MEPPAASPALNQVPHTVKEPQASPPHQPDNQEPATLQATKEPPAEPPDSADLAQEHQDLQPTPSKLKNLEP